MAYHSILLSHYTASYVFGLQQRLRADGGGAEEKSDKEACFTGTKSKPKYDDIQWGPDSKVEDLVTHLRAGGKPDDFRAAEAKIRADRKYREAEEMRKKKEQEKAEIIASRAAEEQAKYEAEMKPFRRLGISQKIQGNTHGTTLNGTGDVFIRICLE